MSSPRDRRRFLREAGLGLASATAFHLSASALRAAGANEQIQVGVIGPGGMGMSHLGELVGREDVVVSHVCDVDAQRLAAAAQLVRDRTGRDVQAVSDLRRVLDDPQVDAVWIATPDHWHAPATILACAAGKHVYVEKPCSHNLREGRLMVEAARRHKRIVQVGTQSRSTAHVIEAMRALQEGIIGDVLVAKAWNSQRRGSIGRQQPCAPPAHLDYDLWLGPAPVQPYQPNLLPGVWRWWHAFGAGDIGNDGVHDIDLARWGLGVDGHPHTITALGGKYVFDDDQQWPDTQYVVFEYPATNGFPHPRQLIFEQRIWSPYFQEGHENGNAFYGTKGMMILGKKSGWQVVLERNQPGPSMEGTFSLPDHHQNFLDSVRSGSRPRADIEIGHLTASLCHLGNIATRVNRVVHFDPATEQVIGDDEAAGLLRRTYRDHWATPRDA
ncbi:MAG: Gfo/Idh/MocA family oxidoreductase [Pirellulaceae bacterium]|jgi:predicted dehydrogenase|nr:Gfo/Idh/MocA family oxidoreductase [Pirellulaceae bacterium]